MFNQLLGKPLQNYDLSVFENYTPENIINYHHHSELEISLDTYWQLKEIGGNTNDNIRMWIHFFDEVLGAGIDLETAQNNPGQSRIGPYYYPDTNTVIYFRSGNIPGEKVNDVDIGYLLSLAKPPIPNERIVKYHHSLKK